MNIRSLAPLVLALGCGEIEPIPLPADTDPAASDTTTTTTGDDDGSSSDESSSSSDGGGPGPDDGSSSSDESSSTGEPEDGLPSGHLLFPNQGLNAVVQFDPVSRTVVGEIQVPEPYEMQSRALLFTALVREADDAIFVNVLEDGDAVLLMMDAEGQELAAVAPGTEFLQQLVFDPLDSDEEAVLGGAPFSNDVVALTPSAGGVATRLTIGDGNIIGLALDGDQLLVGDFASGIVSVHEADGSYVSDRADLLALTTRSEINGMTLDDEGNLYVCQNSSERVVKIDPGGALVSMIESPAFARPQTVHFNPDDGLLYVGSFEHGEVAILTTDGDLDESVDLGGNFLGQPAQVP